MSGCCRVCLVPATTHVALSLTLVFRNTRCSDTKRQYLEKLYKYCGDNIDQVLTLQCEDAFMILQKHKQNDNKWSTMLNHFICESSRHSAQQPAQHAVPWC